jgi:hypothetical protein
MDDTSGLGYLGAAAFIVKRPLVARVEIALIESPGISIIAAG